MFKIKPKNSDLERERITIQNSAVNLHNMENDIIHRSEDRGYANHGWLEAKHSFSFASWYNPEKVHFGVLRVLNDDKIAPGMGFGTHPHDNMEIITIPLEGALAHKDSMGNGTTIHAGDVQVMSAGTGILHSEFNASGIEICKLFQIWLFPNKRNVEPRYQQIQLDSAKMNNSWLQILSPDSHDEGVWIHQDAWFHMGEFDKDSNTNYSKKKTTNGIYLLVISGKIEVNNHLLNERDALGTITQHLEIHIKEKAKLLLMEIPMDVSNL